MAALLRLNLKRLRYFDWGSVNSDYTLIRRPLLVVSLVVLAVIGVIISTKLAAGGTLPSSISADDVVRDSSGNVIGYYTPGDLQTSKGQTKAAAFARVQSQPYGLGWDDMTEGEKWLAQRDYFDRQNNVFQSRAAANSMSIRRANQPESLALDRSASLYNQQTAQQTCSKSVAICSAIMLPRRVRLIDLVCRLLFPGASTWDLLGLVRRLRRHWSWCSAGGPRRSNSVCWYIKIWSRSCDFCRSYAGQFSDAG